jgi:hypothetical protein
MESAMLTVILVTPGGRMHHRPSVRGSCKRVLKEITLAGRTVEVLDFELSALSKARYHSSNDMFSFEYEPDSSCAVQLDGIELLADDP